MFISCSALPRRRLPAVLARLVHAHELHVEQERLCGQGVESRGRVAVVWIEQERLCGQGVESRSRSTRIEQELSGCQKARGERYSVTG